MTQLDLWEGIIEKTPTLTGIPVAKSSSIVLLDNFGDSSTEEWVMEVSPLQNFQITSRSLEGGVIEIRFKKTPR